MCRDNLLGSFFYCHIAIIPVSAMAPALAEKTRTRHHANRAILSKHGQLWVMAIFRSGVGHRTLA